MAFMDEYKIDDKLLSSLVALSLTSQIQNKTNWWSAHLTSSRLAGPAWGWSWCCPSRSPGRSWWCRPAWSPSAEIWGGNGIKRWEPSAQLETILARINTFSYTIGHHWTRYDSHKNHIWYLQFGPLSFHIGEK